MRLIFASQNAHKVAEIQALMPAGIVLLGLSDVGHTAPLAEDGNTLEANALQKARFVYQQFGSNCFSDDTGLVVPALMGAPGVDSAHYAGPQRNASDNIQKLLKELQPSKNRAAHFKSVFALIWEGKEYLFEGVVKGTIVLAPRGQGGFGYDPVFQPENCHQTFAEMQQEEKNSLSHRARALEKMLDFIRTKI